MRFGHLVLIGLAIWVWLEFGDQLRLLWKLANFLT